MTIDVECAPFNFCDCCYFVQQGCPHLTEAVFLMEINPLLNALKDLTERTSVLRGYL